MASVTGARPRNSQVANLHRFVNLDDRFDTQVFTFVAPSHLSKGFINETFSREFIYGNQRWCVQLTRSERNVGTFLVLKNVLVGMTVKVDYTFTVLNREHFTRNESFQEKGVCFTVDNNCHGRSTFIGATDLTARNFLFDDSRFLIELELRNPVTQYREDMQLPREQRDFHSLNKLESSYFTFGSCDWNLAISFLNKKEENDNAMVTVQRHSRLDYWCRIRYRAVFSWGDRQISTHLVEQLLNVNGYCQGQEIDGSIVKQLNTRHPLRLKLEMLDLCPIVIVDVLPTSRNKNCARCYDIDKQEWILESDILGRIFKLRLYYADIRNVPRHFTRLVCWNTFLMPFDRSKPPLRAINSPFCCYYSQKENDEGFEMAFDLPVEEICDNNAGYIDPNNSYLTVQIEWFHSHLLYHDFYHHYDDVSRIQKHQMKLLLFTVSREIVTLQAENDALEKQMKNFHQNINKDLTQQRFGPIPAVKSIPYDHPNEANGSNFGTGVLQRGGSSSYPFEENSFEALASQNQLTSLQSKKQQDDKLPLHKQPSNYFENSIPLARFQPKSSEKSEHGILEKLTNWWSDVSINHHKNNDLAAATNSTMDIVRPPFIPRANSPSSYLKMEKIDSHFNDYFGKGSNTATNGHEKPRGW